jgi:hypothetical protein
MARPLASSKQSVDLASARVPGSRIRRDPPPKVKEVPVRDIEEHDRRNAVIGVVTFALALFVIMIGFSSMSGWSPSEYVLHLDEKDM